MWLTRDLTQAPQQIEPEAMVLDLTMFSESSSPTQAPALTPKATRPIPIKAPQKTFEPPRNLTTKTKLAPPPKKANTPVPHEETPIALPHEIPTAPIKPITKQTTKTAQPKEAEKKQKKKRKAKKNKASQASARRRFIRHNLGRIMRISQRTLRRLGIPHVRSRRHNARATVSFRLHPSGAISGLHIKRHSGIRALDRRTLQVIRTAHRRYPRPKVTVQVVITMQYRL